MVSSQVTSASVTVDIGSACWPMSACIAGVPQGSVLEPILLSVYIAWIAHLSSSHSVLRQQYADETQLFIALSSSNYTTSIASFCCNGLALNADKSDVIIVGIWQQLRNNHAHLMKSTSSVPKSLFLLQLVFSVQQSTRLWHSTTMLNLCAKILLSYTSIIPHPTNANRRQFERKV